MWVWAELAASKEKDAVYLYEFTRAPQYPRTSRYFGLGATHGVELQYVFGHLDPQVAAWDSADRRLARAMATYWARFAKTGNPNGRGLPPWPEFIPNRPQVMQLGKRIHAEPLPNVRPLHEISQVYKALKEQSHVAARGGA